MIRRSIQPLFEPVNPEMMRKIAAAGMMLGIKKSVRMMSFPCNRPLQKMVANPNATSISSGTDRTK